MTDSRFFVFIYPAPGKVSDYLNLAVYLLSPNEKWPAHVTVAGPFKRRPRSRAQKDFRGTMFSMGVWNFFQNGLPTVYLKVGMIDLWSYWSKPDFIGDPVPHLSLYNGKSMEEGRKIFSLFSQTRLQFGFEVHGIEVIDSNAQKRFDLREKVNPSSTPSTMGMTIDELSQLPFSERLELAGEALALCRDESLIQPSPRLIFPAFR